MSSTALKILALLTLLLAIGLGYIAYRMSQSMTAPVATTVETQQQQELAYTMAVVTVKPIKAYQTVKPEDIELVPVSVLPGDYFENKDAVLGKTPLIDIDTGTTLTARLFKDVNLLSQSIPKGYRAMSLEIDDVIAVGGFVQPGDHIDALFYVRAVGKEVTSSQARLLLERAKVLAYEEQIIEELAQEEDQPATKNQNKNRRRKRTVVLAIPEKDTVKVMLAASIGDIRLALHGDAENDEHTMSPEAMAATTTSSTETGAKAKNVITLQELTALKKRKAQRKSAYVPRSIPVYRGSQVETVRR